LAVETIELELDENGSPVTLEAAAWYVCFVPGLKKQWWHRFVNKRHKHVFAMKPAGPGEWTLLEPWWHRLLTAAITSEQARKFLLWGARGDVLHVREFILTRQSSARLDDLRGPCVLSARTAVLGMDAAWAVQAPIAGTECLPCRCLEAGQTGRRRPGQGIRDHLGLR
jgi:hypothetical protein